MRLDPIAQIEHDFNKVDNIQSAIEVLNKLLAPQISVWMDGSLYYVRHLIDKLYGLRIEIYSSEHAPPHFHVNGNDINAAFSIIDGSYLYGDIPSSIKRKIEYWSQQEKVQKTLIDSWNSTRPFNCPVGKIDVDKTR